jgi:parallel beta-helix repeat protein
VKTSYFRIVAAALFLLCSTQFTRGDALFRVSPDGNDSHDPAAKPLATLNTALQKARQARKDNPHQKITIELATGRYPLAHPLELAAEDSGPTAQQPLIITAAPNQKPVISGGRPITGWKKDSANPKLWKTTLPEVRDGQWYFRQLFINGARKQRARTPNDGFFRIQGASPQDQPVKIKFANNDIKKEWAGADSDVELIAFLAWADIRMQIRQVDDHAKVATLSGNPRPSNKEENARYYIENAPDALDAPGEWYLNRKTGELTFWAENEEDLTKTEVIAPFLPDLLRARGTPEKPIKHLIISGISFEHTDWELPASGYADTQAAIAVRGDLFFEFASDNRIADCKFAHLAGYAIELGKGAQRFTILGNEMHDLGGGGIRLGEPAKPKTPAEENHTHQITDNAIHHAGLVFPPASGVFILQSGTNRVAHNHIHHLYYTAISVGWNWGYQETPCRANIIEFNHMHDIGQGMLSDMGGVYTLGIQRGTIIRNNLIHDVSASTYGGWGLYTDEGSTDILLENNIVYNCKHAGFHQHYGRDNIIRNNIFAFNKENQVMRTRPEEHISFYFTNNIVYFDSGNLLGSNWSNDNYRVDYNLYYDVRDPEGKQLKCANFTFADWQKRGHDQHSLIADPKFVDPKKFNFTLQPDSPALKLGFKPIDLTKVGIRPKSVRIAN